MNRRIGRQRGFLGLDRDSHRAVDRRLAVHGCAEGVRRDVGRGADPQVRAGTEPARGPGLAGTDSREVTTATPAPVNALDKARGLESAVREQAADQSRRIDEATK